MIIRRQLKTGLALRLGVLLLRTAIAPLIVATFCSVASAEGTSSAPRVEQRTAPGTADAFSDAIARGDSAAARALLMPGVLIFESGGAEQSADEYSRHHLPSDIKFMAGMKVERLSRNSGGDQATSWVATKSRMRGHYKGKTVDLDATETLVLALTSAGWRIAHIHWSSSPHRGGGGGATIMGEFLIAAQGGRRSTFCPMLMKFIRKAYQHLLAGMPTGHQTMTGRSSLCRVTVSGVTSSSAHSSGC